MGKIDVYNSLRQYTLVNRLIATNTTKLVRLLTHFSCSLKSREPLYGLKIDTIKIPWNKEN